MSSDKQESICEFYPEVKRCSYDPTKESKFRYFFIENCSNSMCHLLIERGWRRFGRFFFVPICQACNECITIRYLVDEFRFSKNHKRIKKLNKDLEIVLSKPTVNLERLELYNRYHAYMNKKKGWEYTPITAWSYNNMFVDGFEDFGYELSFRLKGELICVSLLDILPKALSAIYCFYDPSFAHRSLGTFSILTQMELAKRCAIPYIYPGYWIKDHHSMGYKERFKPFEILINRPDIDEPTLWSRYE